MKQLFLYGFLLISALGFSQHKKSEEKVVEIRVNTAELTLYLVGGLASPITKETLQFGNKYSIAFHDFGCTPPMPLEKYEHNNFHVFDVLTHHFGNRWEKELNINVIGLDKWKSSHRG